MRRLSLGAILVNAVLTTLTCFAPVASRAEEGDLKSAKDAFEYGSYEQARVIAQNLIERNVLASDEDLIDANRIVGLAFLYGNDLEREAKAERYFLDVLSVEPDYKLDPFFTPPQAVQFFDRVREKYAAHLEPIRKQRQFAKAARQAEEELRRRAKERIDKEQEARATSPKVREITKRYLPVVFLPLGAGQFQNGDATTGVLLAAVQVVAGVASVVSYSVIEGLRQPSSGGFPGGELQLASTLDIVKWSSAGAFYLAWGYGVADAWVNFTPESIRELEAELPLPVQPAAPAKQETSSSQDGKGVFRIAVHF